MTVNRMYSDIDQQTRDAFRRLADYMYKKYGGSDVPGLSDIWVDKILDAYDPVVKYVYSHEVERKAARLAESILASNTKSKEIETALRYWTVQMREFAVRITDEAVSQALIDSGEEEARWITEKDERVCKVCEARDGKIYPLSRFPSKPHIGCRCRRERIRQNDKS